MNFLTSTSFALLLGTLCFLFLAVVLALLNRRVLLQLYYEGQGARAFQAGRFREAETHFRRAWELMPSQGAARSRLLEWLTRVTQMQGNYDDAERYASDWLHHEEATGDPDGPRLASAKEALAHVHVALARYQHALPLLEDAFHIRTARKDREPLEYATCLHALSVLHINLNQPERLKPFVEQALSIVPQQFDVREGFLVARGMCTLLLLLDRIDEAEKIAQDTLRVAQSSSPSHSLPVAAALLQLASVRQRQERFDEAEALVRQALAIKKSLHPTNPMQWHEELHLLANVLRHQSRWAEADECYRETLRLREEYLAPTDAATARVLEDYAELLELMGRGEEAHQLLHRARHIRSFHVPPD